MLTRISIILLLSLWLSLQDHSAPKDQKTFSIPRAALTRLYLVRYDFSDPMRAQLLARYAGGIRTKLSFEIQEAHEKMHLLHLFTPSGLHFSALYLWLLPLYWRYKKTHSKWLLLPLFVLAFTPQFLDGYYSLKRMGLLKAAFLLNTLSGLKISSFSLFIITFTFDYIWGTYQHSPQSYQLSFLFIGLLFSVLGQPKIFLFSILMLGQLLVSAFSETSFYPLGYSLGFFYTAIFSMLFPILAMIFWLSPYLPSTPLESLLALLEMLLESLLSIARLGPILNPGVIMVSGVFIWLVLNSSHRTMAKIVLFLSLTLDPSPLFSKKIDSKQHPARFQATQSQQAIKPRWIKSGISYKNEKSQRCHARLSLGHRWLESCR